MAGLVAWIPFDSSKLNLSSIAAYADLLKPELKKGYNLSDGTKVYPDALLYYWFLDDDSLGVSAFVGSDFALNNDSDAPMGMVEAYIEISLSMETGESENRFVINGLDTPLADIETAIKTSDVTDDYAIIAKSFEKNGIFIGSLFDDALTGYNGDDFFIPGAGNDLIDGGSGKNSIFYTGKAIEYQISNSERNISITDRIDGRDGHDELRNIYKLDFSDCSIILDRTARNDFIYSLYEAVLDRMPDVNGFFAWSETGQLAKLSDVPSSVSTEVEGLSWKDYSEIFGLASDVGEIISNYYAFILGREPDEGGMNFWSDLIYKGTSKEIIYSAFINSEEYKDKIWLADQFLNSMEALPLKGLSNTEYIQKITENLLGEDTLFPSSVEWVDLLNRGTSRSVALVGMTFFADSHSSLMSDIGYGYMVA